MKIAILLPYKEDYTQKYSGAVSIHVSNLLDHSLFKQTTFVYGNTNRKQFLSSNFINIKINSNILSSNNRKYLSKFIDLNKKEIPHIIEIHNRPTYVDIIKKNLRVSPRVIKKKLDKFDPKKSSGKFDKLNRFLNIKNLKFVKLEDGITKTILAMKK